MWYCGHNEIVFLSFYSTLGPTIRTFFYIFIFKLNFQWMSPAPAKSSSKPVIVNFSLHAPLPCVFRCERMRINNPTLASESPWSHEWNLGNNTNHLFCDVAPAQRGWELQKHLTEEKHLAKEPQRFTHTLVPEPESLCRSIHHRDKALGSIRLEPICPSSMWQRSQC